MSLDKKLTELFALFQDEDKNVVPVKEIPTLVRAMGLVPTESEMKKAVTAMVGEESSDSVHLAAFLTVAKKLVLDRRFPPNTKTELQAALNVIGKEGKKFLEENDPSYAQKAGSYGERKQYFPPGTLLRDEFLRLLTTEGESLNQDEAEELMVTLPLQDNERINIEVYSNQLTPTMQIT